jgi:hypothetical protein
MGATRIVMTPEKESFCYCFLSENCQSPCSRANDNYNHSVLIDQEIQSDQDDQFTATKNF